MDELIQNTVGPHEILAKGYVSEQPRFRYPEFYSEGPVRTPHGIVFVQSWGYSSNGGEQTFYETIIDGKSYHTHENRTRTPRGYAIMAGKWIDHVVQGTDQ